MTIPLITSPRSLDSAWLVFGRMVENARAWAHEEGLTKAERTERYVTVKHLQAAQQRIEDMDARKRLKERRATK